MHLFNLFCTFLWVWVVSHHRNHKYCDTLGCPFPDVTNAAVVPLNHTLMPHRIDGGTKRLSHAISLFEVVLASTYTKNAKICKHPNQKCMQKQQHHLKLDIRWSQIARWDDDMKCCIISDSCIFLQMLDDCVSIHISSSDGPWWLQLLWTVGLYDQNGIMQPQRADFNQTTKELMLLMTHVCKSSDARSWEKSRCLIKMPY